MPQNNNPLLIGITGTFGSGKSLFCWFVEQHYRVVYADKLADLVLNKREITHKLKMQWGDLILKNGKPDKKLISQIVFSNNDELFFLNSLIHPEVLRAMQDIVDNSQELVLFFEVPLLFETKLEHCFDHVVLVQAVENIRINRLLQNRNLSESEINSRIKNQMEDNIKMRMADTVIQNNGSKKELAEAVEKFLSGIHNIKHKEKISFTNGLI